MEKSKRKFNHRHFICWFFLALVATWSVFVCRDSYIRLFYTGIDFGLSIVYALFFLYEWCPVPALDQIKNVDVVSHFPQSWIALAEDFDVLVELFFSRDNFANWLIYISPRLTTFTQLLMLGTLVYAVFYIIKNF